MMKIFSNLKEARLDNKKKFLIVLFCAIIAYVDISFILKPQMAFLQKLSVKASKYKMDFEKFQKETAEMKRIKSDSALMKNKPQNSKRIMAESDIGALLQNISDSANKFDVKIIQIKPLKEIVPAVDKMPGTDKFVPLAIVLDTVSDYHQLGKFINSLENGDIYLRVAELKITVQNNDYFKQRYALAIKTYVKR